MRQLFHRFAKPPIIIGTAVVVAVVAIAVAYVYTNERPAGSYVTPTVGTIVEEVDATGAVKAADTLDLGFQIGGKISYAGPAVGTHVSAGATLATLSSADLEASVEQAQAALQVQEANLSSLQAGATPQTVAVSQTAVSNAQTGVAQAKQSVIQAAQDAYQKSDDAVHNKVDQFFQNPRTPSPTLAFNLSNSQDQSTLISGRASIETLLDGWQQYLSTLPSDPTQVDTVALASTTRQNLQQVTAFLNLVASGLTEAIPTASYPSATIQGYEASVAVGRANVSADVGAINAAQTAEKSAESTLASAQSQLTLVESGATTQALAAQTAQVAAAQANLDAANAQLAKTVISAPIAGTITVNNAEPGEIAAAGAPQISMISDSQFEFEIYVSDIDLAKVAVGDSAEIDLDAYEGQPFPAHVMAVDPAATIQNGVSSYKVTLEFDGSDPRIEAGETGSAKITTQTHTNALSVPTSAIITNGTDHFVLKQSGGADLEVPVTTGISSAAGYTEILSGLSPNDKIRAFGTQQ